MRAIRGLLASLGGLAVVLISSALIMESASAADKNDQRRYYLTTIEHTGAQATMACAVGFHMASLWEIFDPSNLRYETVLGVTADDAGSGPPTALAGWIRTGTAASGFLPAPRANCHAWKSSEASDSGSVVRLTPFWGFDALAASPWAPGSRSCDTPARVWCVEDVD